MLLLVGPPGCGKTATVHTLTREMGCAVLEWANPVADVGGSESGKHSISLWFLLREFRIVTPGTTVEPPNNGQVRDEHFVHCSEVVPSSEVEMCGQLYRQGVNSCPL